MASVGTIEPFNISEPLKWKTYLERFQFFLTANGITDQEKKKAVFLSICGPSTYDIIHSLIAPQAVSEVDLKTITDKLSAHFLPRTSTVVARYLFHRREQKLEENIASYIKELRRLAGDCGFADTILEEMLRDRIVCGVRDENLQRRLLAEPNLTFKKAEEMTLAYETAMQSVSALREAPALYTNTNSVRSFQSFSKPNARLCFRCDNAHAPEECPFQEAVCNFCRKRGHIERACLSKKRSMKKTTIPRKKTNSQQAVTASTKQEEVMQSGEPLGDVTNLNTNNPNYEFDIYSIHEQPGSKDFIVPVKINGKDINFELDSGSAYSIIGKSVFDKVFPEIKPNLTTTNFILKDYQRNVIETVGICDVQVYCGSRVAKLPLVVTKSDRASLLGRNWFDPLQIKVSIVKTTSSEKTRFEKLAQEFEDIFAEGLGHFKGPPINLEVDKSFKPVLMKARKVPFALKPAIERELSKLEEQGILEPIAYPKWATPIVPVMKPNNQVRICADYSQSVNLALRKDVYPVPCVQEMLATLAGGRVFAKLDLSQAYQQLSVDSESADVQTIITHQGAYRVTRLQFGISTAPQIFQRFIETRLAGISGVLPYFDDILIVAVSEDQLEQRLRTVFQRLREDGLHLRREKCVLFATELEFLGFKISSAGIHPAEVKLNAIKNARDPTNKTELQAFLGLVNFYHIFLKDKATIAEPLHQLLHKDKPWKWGPLEQKAFCDLKNLLTSDACLAHYEEQRPLILTCDASPYGVGAVLSQIDDSGREVPVAYHSRTLSASERNFAQVDREALACIVGVRKFHNYMFGRFTQIRTDHKPLLGILASNKPVPEILSPRMLRWRLILGAYRYELIYVPGRSIPHADALSRLPLDDHEETVPPAYDVLMLENVPETFVSAEQIEKETSKDPVLSKILTWTLKGWPINSNQIPSDCKPYWLHRNEISAYKGCLLWGTRVIIPPGGRKQVISVLHEAHPGIVKMKALARSYVWWPGLDEEIQNAVTTCDACQQSRHMPKKTTVHPWEWSTAPWARIHIDHAGPINGNLFLIVVDSYSKWLEVRRVPSTSAEATIRVLRELFATHGLCDVIVSDNGSGFASEEFQVFLRNNGIRHARVAPYHPAGNGQAERMVQSTKEALLKMTGEVHTKLFRYLLHQHVTPHATTGRSPAEMLMNRRISTALDRMHPNFIKTMKAKQEATVNMQPPRIFDMGETVFARNYAQGSKWTPATVKAAVGPVSYKLATPEGNELHRHVNQMRRRCVSGKEDPPPSENVPLLDSELQVLPSQLRNEAMHQPDQNPTVSESLSSPVQKERPIREHRRPKYLEDYVD